MAGGPLQRSTGRVFRVEPKHGAVRYAKYRLPDGRRVQREARAERLRCIEHDRGRKPSAVAGYKVMVRSMLLPAFGELQLAVRFGPRPRC